MKNDLKQFFFSPLFLLVCQDKFSRYLTYKRIISALLNLWNNIYLM